jgi:flagellar motor switch protein FliN/FliY
MPEEFEEGKMTAKEQGFPAGEEEASLEEFEEHGGKAKTTPHNIDFILDIPLELTVELGHTSMLINDLLQLGQGSVVELNKLAGEPLEILVNRKLIARGEVVVVNEKFGVRLTDIVSPIERVKSLA